MITADPVSNRDRIVVRSDDDALITVTFCADPRPHEVIWTWGSQSLLAGKTLFRYVADPLDKVSVHNRVRGIIAHAPLCRQRALRREVRGRQTRRLHVLPQLFFSKSYNSLSGFGLFVRDPRSECGGMDLALPELEAVAFSKVSAQPVAREWLSGSHVQCREELVAVLCAVGTNAPGDIFPLQAQRDCIGRSVAPGSSADCLRIKSMQYI